MTDEREVRQTMAAGLVSAAAKDDRIVVLDADLMSCHSTKCFLEAYPERFINVGIAEANLIGVAAGMAAFGKIPFAFSFAPFATRRCYDQIFISVAYSKLPVKIVGSDPGVMAEANGGTHMPFEDMSIMRAIPHMVCFEPTDATMLEKALPEIIDYPGAVYIRMFRKKAEKIYDDSLEFKLGKAVTLKDGGDVTLIASGIMVARALKAADELKEAGIDARVLNIHTWKPIDEDAIVSAAKDTGAIVTCENHTTAGGLGSAVAEVAAEKCPVPMEFVGVKNSFGEVGKEAYLSEKFGLTVSDIVAAAKRAVARK
ncbi:MAG TPA: transketolase family protein [Candidatus Limadaptatus stercoripullorum]|uniref:Transketolase family protein n=1 Tax=Candidatus Limadaptatus stercoripullorum TaxID=2840846 RepID=A0A9D1SWL4_9FIRM|nr:transketolase family protein [Candidatus Limadaptatus stercoripullorum]